MIRSQVSRAASAALGLALLVAAAGRSPARAAAPDASVPLAGTAPMYVENVGQFAGGARFMLRGGATTVFVTTSGLWLTRLEPAPRQIEPAVPDGPPAPASEKLEPRRGVHLKLSFTGAQPEPLIEGFNPLATRVSYFSGADPANWQAGVPVWGGVRYRDLYPGIDVELTGQAGALQLRLVTTGAGASLGQVSLRVEGADGLRVEDGRAVAQTSVGDIHVPLLVTDNPPEGSASATSLGDQTFEISAPFAAAFTGQAAAPAVWPSSLAYSTFLGGASSETGAGLAVNSAGEVYVTGRTASADFPIVAGGFDTLYADGDDVFVAKLNAAGSGLIYATYLGGASYDQGYRIAVDGSGSAYVVGHTGSPDYPTTAGAYDTIFNNTGFCGNVACADIFMTKLSAAGTSLVYSTFVGGRGWDAVAALAVDATGAAHITGNTSSVDFPTTAGAYDAVYNNGDAFVLKLNVAGTALSYSTLLGGTSYDSGHGLTVDASGNIYVTGTTISSDFPTTAGAFDTSYSNGDDFVTKLNPSVAGLIYSTFLGGSANEGSSAIAIDGSGSAYIIGGTNSSDFPVTSGAFDTSLNGSDLFIAKLSAQGSAMVYATFLGGSATENITGLAVDVNGAAYVTGYTNSSDFPTTANAFDPVYAGGTCGTGGSAHGCYDAFLVRLNPAGTALQYASFLGGAADDLGYGLVVASDGTAAYLAGHTESSDFPLAGSPVDSTFASHEAFVAKILTPASGVDAWLLTTALAFGPPAGLADIPLWYGNNGLTTATSTSIVVTLGSGLTYASDTSGIAPVVSGSTLTWNNLPSLAFLGSGQFTLRVNVPSASYGTRYSFTATINSAGPEANSADNTMVGEVVVGRQLFLTLIYR